MILGYANYNDDKYPFVYENEKLKLLPGSLEKWDEDKEELISSLGKVHDHKDRNKWIENKHILGITSKDEKILFITDNIPSNNNGFKQYNIQVIYKYLSNSDEDGLISGLMIKSDEINYFFHPSRAFQQNVNFSEERNLESIKFELEDKFKRIKDFGKYSHNGISIHVKVGIETLISSKIERPILAESKLYLEFDKPIAIEEALEFIWHQESFLKYISYRENIKLKSIDVIKRNSNNSIEKTGEIVLNELINSDDNRDRAKKVLTYELLEGKIIPILESIADEELYLKHLCKDTNSRRKYDVSRVILLFAAFEKEYKNFQKGEKVRSESYFELKKDALNALDELIINNKTRKYIESIKKSIDYNDNILSACLRKAIMDNMKTIKIFLEYHYGNAENKLINDISQRLASLRNKIAHGNLDLEIKPEHISDLKILENLIYIMRLNSMEIDIELIQKGICELMGYNIKV